MIIGHQKVISFLDKITKGGAASRAYLFVGPQGVGKRHTALEFSKWMQGDHPESFTDYAKKDCPCTSCASIARGSHPDVQMLVAPLSIEDARDIKKAAAQTPFMGPLRIYIIDGADQMGQEAAHALLKEIEEPTSRTVFFLIARSTEALIPTITSRCSVCSFSLVPASCISRALFSGEAMAKELWAMEPFWQGRPGYLLHLLNDPAAAREMRRLKLESDILVLGTMQERLALIEKLCARERSDILATIPIWMAFLRKKGYYSLIDYLGRTCQDIEKYNTNAQIALENMIVKDLVQKSRTYA